MDPARPLLTALLLLAGTAAFGEEAGPPLSLGTAFAAAAPHVEARQAVPTTRVATQAWGRMNPSSITLRAATDAGGDHVADVLFDNHLTTGNVDIKQVSLGIEGLVVHVTIVHGMDRIPDRLEVEPPLGFVAVPPSVMVEDGAVGAIRIHRLPIG